MLSNSIKEKKKIQLNNWAKSSISKESTEYRPKKVKFDPVVSFLNACLDFDRNEIEKMLSTGINIDSPDNDNLTALHQACINNNMELVEFLLEKNANINAMDKERWTPLHISCETGEYELTRLLIKKGARLDIANVDGDLPYHLIKKENSGIKNFVRQEMEKRKIDIQKVIDYESSLMLQDIYTWKTSGNYDPPIDNVNKSTPLHVAASKNYTEVIKNLLPLLSQSDIDSQDIDGWTPLHAAAHWSHFETCSVLIEAGADHKIRTYSDETIYDLVDEEHREEFKNKMNQVIRAVENNKKHALFTQPLIRQDGNSRRKSSILRQSQEVKKNVQMKEPIEEGRALLRGSLLCELPEQLIEDEVDDAGGGDGNLTITSTTTTNTSGGSGDKSKLKNNMEFATIRETDETTSEPVDISIEGDDLNKGSCSSVNVTTPELSVATEYNEQILKPITIAASIITVPKIKSAQEIIDDNRTSVEAIDPPQVSVDDDTSVSSSAKVVKNEDDDDENDFSVKIRPQRIRSEIAAHRSTLTRGSIAMPPAKVEQAEVERRETARRVRSSRRSTQGITKEDLQNVEIKHQQKLLQEKLSIPEQSEYSDDKKISTITTTTTTKMTSQITLPDYSLTETHTSSPASSTSSTNTTSLSLSTSFKNEVQQNQQQPLLSTLTILSPPAGTITALINDSSTPQQQQQQQNQQQQSIDDSSNNITPNSMSPTIFTKDSKHNAPIDLIPTLATPSNNRRASEDVEKLNQTEYKPFSITQRHHSVSHDNARTSIMSFLNDKMGSRNQEKSTSNYPNNRKPLTITTPISSSSNIQVKMPLQNNSKLMVASINPILSNTTTVSTIETTSSTDDNNHSAAITPQIQKINNYPTNPMTSSMSNENKANLNNTKHLSDGSYVARRITGNTLSNTSANKQIIVTTEDTVESDKSSPTSASINKTFLDTSRITPSSTGETNYQSVFDNSEDAYNAAQNDGLVPKFKSNILSESKLTTEQSRSKIRSETNNQNPHVLPHHLSTKLVLDEVKKKELYDKINVLEEENKRLKQDLNDRNSSDNNGELSTKEMALTKELEKYRDENRILRSQKEALLRVISKIQSELETLHINNNNSSQDNANNDS